MRFDNKNVLITGGSRGIGKATAIAFSESGANVGINYLANESAANKTLAELGSGQHRLFKGDVKQDGIAEKLINDFIGVYGTIDILVNNVGISTPHEPDQVDFKSWKAAWKEIIDTNLIAVADMSYWASQAMITNGGGRIVNVSSRGSFRGEPTKPAYGASKAGLNSLSQSMAKALAKHNIFIGVVAPGFTATEMGMQTLTEVEKENLLRESPFKRTAKPEEVAHAILFLASSGAEYTSGTIIDVNGASYLRS